MVFPITDGDAEAGFIAGAFDTWITGLGGVQPDHTVGHITAARSLTARLDLENHCVTGRSGQCRAVVQTGSSVASEI